MWATVAGAATSPQFQTLIVIGKLAPGSTPLGTWTLPERFGSRKWT
jgi:hypothetical protein